MDNQERRIVEVGYNLLQAFIKARRENNIEILKSIVTAIYGFNGIAKEIIPKFSDMDIGKDLFKIGKIWHEFLMSAEIDFGIGQGLHIEEKDFNLEDLKEVGNSSHD